MQARVQPLGRSGLRRREHQGGPFVPVLRGSSSRPTRAFRRVIASGIGSGMRPTVRTGIGGIRRICRMRSGRWCGRRWRFLRGWRAETGSRRAIATGRSRTRSSTSPTTGSSGALFLATSPGPRVCILPQVAQGRSGQGTDIRGFGLQQLHDPPVVRRERLDRRSLLPPRHDRTGYRGLVLRCLPLRLHVRGSTPSTSVTGPEAPAASLPSRRTERPKPPSATPQPCPSSGNSTLMPGKTTASKAVGLVRTAPAGCRPPHLR